MPACAVVGCNTNQGRSNKHADPYVTCFKFPDAKNHPALRKKWISFCGQDDFTSPTRHQGICIRHFLPECLSKTAKLIPRLDFSLNPIPTLHGPKSQVVLKASSSPMPRVDPRDRAEERLGDWGLALFEERDRIASYEDIDRGLAADVGLEFRQSGDAKSLYELLDGDRGPQVRACITVSPDRKVKLYYKSCPLPLPDSFRSTGRCILSRRSQLNDLYSHCLRVGEGCLELLEEFRAAQFLSRRTYSAQMLRFCLHLRYTSKAAYLALADQVPLPSLSMLKKIVAGDLDPAKVLKFLIGAGAITKDVTLMYDEVFLSCMEEYSSGVVVGSDAETGELFKGILTFMIVGIGGQKGSSYVIRSVPEVKITGTLISEELKAILTTLDSAGLDVRAVVSDNHKANISAAGLTLESNGQQKTDLKLDRGHGKSSPYIFYDTVHLMKSVRNNFYNAGMVTFPAFKASIDAIALDIPASFAAWDCIEKAHYRDQDLQCCLRNAPSLTSRAVKPLDCKQNVKIALAIFQDKTRVALERLCGSEFTMKGTKQFLELIDTFWLTANSKSRYHPNPAGNACVPGDGKPGFFRAFATWARACSFTDQTRDALVRTSLCLASLTEDLLREYDYVLTGRFQSDPLERQFGSWRQMSGGQFLISLLSATKSDKINKLKKLLELGVDPAGAMLEEDPKWVQDLEGSVESMDVDRFKIHEKTRPIAAHIAGYCAFKLRGKCPACDRRMF
eukprot:UC4_evm1s837